MFWHSDMESTLKAVEGGHPVVMSPTSFCYFDYSYDKIPTSKVYSYDPVPDGLDENYVQNILGVQANFWSHIDRTVPRMNRQIFPRLLALSEVAWTEKGHKNWQQFRNRLQAQEEILKIMDIYYFSHEE
ncbi:MAG: family 20 glycosylhydrolase, partial [Actinobacteria bacterium]|nr:family 20 glycosylhydrolase [Actinomycetota bacterium]